MSLRPLRAAVAGWQPPAGTGLVATTNDPLAALAAAWPEIVGPRIAARATPVAISADALVVATVSSAWSAELQMLSVPIIAGLAALPAGRGISKLIFRSGRRRAERVRPATPVAPAARQPAAGGPYGRDPAPPLAPAADVAEALARLRRRFAGREQSAAGCCSECGVPRDVRGGRCGPCAGAGALARRATAERLLYAAPWLGEAELLSRLPDIEPSELDAIRRALLQRWWLALDRARRAGKLSPGGIERPLASSYLLLKSRLPPERITPAVVRNMLGPELEALLWGSAAQSSNSTNE